MHIMTEKNSWSAVCRPFPLIITIGNNILKKHRKVLPKAALVHLYERVCSVKTRVSFCGEPFLYLECFNIEVLFHTNQQNAVD